MVGLINLLPTSGQLGLNAPYIGGRAAGKNLFQQHHYRVHYGDLASGAATSDDTTMPIIYTIRIICDSVCLVVVRMACIDSQYAPQKPM